MKFEGMSEEAQEVAKQMIDYCINHGIGMGMDEGIADFDSGTKHNLRQELELFSGYKA